jgi:hypothetical protein
VFSNIGLFFSKMAVITFGGAYAVLAYMAQQAVEYYHWLQPGEMLVGLGMAETTPGPLISVVQFVGFMAAFRDPGTLDPMVAGALGGTRSPSGPPSFHAFSGFSWAGRTSKRFVTIKPSPRFRNPKLPELPGTPGPDVPGNLATVAADTGYEIQIDEEARGGTRKGEPDGLLYNRTGTVYKVKTSGSSPGQQNYTDNQRLASGVWHSYEITVTDRTYEVLLNGQPSAKFPADPSDPNERFRGRKKSEDPDSGFIGLQVHTGNVAFANICIKQIG